MRFGWICDLTDLKINDYFKLQNYIGTSSINNTSIQLHEAKLSKLALVDPILGLIKVADLWVLLEVFQMPHLLHFSHVCCWPVHTSKWFSNFIVLSNKKVWYVYPVGKTTYGICCTIFCSVLGNSGFLLWCNLGCNNHICCPCVFHLHVLCQALTSLFASLQRTRRIR